MNSQNQENEKEVILPDLNNEEFAANRGCPPGYVEVGGHCKPKITPPEAPLTQDEDAEA